MGTAANDLAIAAAAGYYGLGDFMLPQSTWWDNCYSSMKKRVALLRSRFAGDAVVQSMLDDAQAEIDVYRQYAEYYGHAFVVLRLR